MDLLEILKAIILGIVEGITEWLPISSTGHMILVDEFIKLDASDEFKEMFLVVIQLGAIMAVVCLFFNKLNPLARSKSFTEKQETLRLWIKVIIGIIPAGIIGLLLDDWLNEHFYNYQTVSLMLIIYGIIFIIVETLNKKQIPQINSFNDLTYKYAFYIGIFQTLALIPGTSRSGATIIGALILGTSRYIAAEFSFFLSIPIMFGASFVKLLKFGFSFTSMELIILFTGMLVAFLVSLFTIKFLLGYIKKNDFKPFGWYRIAIGLVVLIYFLIK
ncbi:MAG: undecaprenyl-diphosphate phosphatase [Bacilli bacterium]|nr:undecaprenyl-diphosphate phosphatase [Bacilli bacterium]